MVISLLRTLKFKPPRAHHWLCQLSHSPTIRKAAQLQLCESGQQTIQAAQPVNIFTCQRRPLTTYNDLSTIFALASAPGRAAIAIIRISGPGCLEVGTTVIVSRLSWLLMTLGLQSALSEGKGSQASSGVSADSV